MRTKLISIVALTLVAACSSSDPDGRIVSESGPTQSVTIDTKETTAPAVTAESTAATTTAPDNPSVATEPTTDTSLLVGAQLSSDEPLFFTGGTDTFSLLRFNEAFGPATRNGDELLVLGDGDGLFDRSMAAITVGTRGVLGDVMMPAIIEPVRVAGADALGRTFSVAGTPISQIDWATPDGYVASITAIGLGLESAAHVAATVTFDGTHPTLVDQSDGYVALAPPSPTPLMVSAMFANGQDGIEIMCLDDGEAGYFSHQVSALAVTQPKQIAGFDVAQRAGESAGPAPEMSALDGAMWRLGGWWCQVWSAPTDINGGAVPVIDEDEMAALMASLVVVDEATFRERAGDATLAIDLTPPAPPPVAASGAFSIGDRVSGQWFARFSPEGDRIMAVDASTVQFIDADSGDLLESFVANYEFTGTCSSEPITADGRLLYDGAAIRDTATGKIVTTAGRPAAPGGGDFSPDGTKLIVSEGRALRATVYDAATGTELASVTPKVYTMMCAEFFPDGNRVLLPGLIGTIYVWDLAADQQLLAIPVGDGTCLLSPDGRFVAVNDEAPRLVDADTGADVTKLSGRTVDFSADGSHLAVQAGAGLEIWDLTTFTSTEIAADVAYGFQDVIFNPDGSRVVTVSNGVAEIHDTTTGDLVGSLALDESTVISASYSPDGTKIVTANSDRSVKIWAAH